MKRSRTRQAGFTLLELMITVVILGVLSAVALVSYELYMRRARTAEAAGLLASIKSNQETYRSEFGLYANVATPCPAAAPSSDGQLWPVPAPPPWRALGFVPDNPRIFFQLDTISGAPGAAPAWGAPLVYTPTLTNDFWFVARAQGDQNNNGTLSNFWITSTTGSIQHNRPME